MNLTVAVAIAELPNTVAFPVLLRFDTFVIARAN